MFFRGLLYFNCNFGKYFKQYVIIIYPNSWENNLAINLRVFFIEKLVEIRVYIFYITHTPAYLRQLSALNSQLGQKRNKSFFKCSTAMGQQKQHYCTKKRATHGSHTLPHTHTHSNAHLITCHTFVAL